MTTVLIVDDHPAFRSTAHALLDHDDFDVVGEASSGLEAVERTRELRPDVVILDVGLPDADGFELARQLTEDESLETRVVLTSNRVFTGFADAIEESGAVGFLPKHELSGAAVRAILDAATEHVP